MVKTTWRVAGVMLAVCVVADPASGSKPAVAKRLPVPAAESVEKSRSLIRDAYESDYTAAKQSGEYADLLEKLYGLADKQTDAVKQYAYLVVAEEVAAENDDVVATLQAIDRRAVLFELDGLDARAKALAGLAKPKVPADLALFEQAKDTAIKAAAAERFDIAIASARLAIDVAREIKRVLDDPRRKKPVRMPAHGEDVPALTGAELVKQAVETQAQVVKHKKLFDEYEAAKTILDTQPEDSAANAKAGTYLCLVAHKWDQGMPHLAKSDHPVLSGIAREEMALVVADRTPKQVFDLARKWWDASGRKGLPEDERNAIQDHAAELYAESLPNLTEQEEAKVAGDRISLVEKRKRKGSDRKIIPDLFPDWETSAKNVPAVLDSVSRAARPCRPRVDVGCQTTAPYDQQGGAVVAPNGNVYCMPSPEGKVLVVDPATRACRFLAVPADAAINGEYCAAVLAPDSRIFGIPHSATKFLTINPATDKVECFGENTVRGAYSGAVVAGNGKIYCVPSCADHVLELDPKTRNTQRIGDIPGGFYKYMGGVLARNGRIYCMPDHAERILEIDPEARRIRLVGQPIDGDFGKACSGVLAPNGKIYSGPYHSRRVTVFDPVEEKISYVEGVSPDVYLAGVLGPDGRIYYVPNNKGKIVVLDPSTEKFETLNDSESLAGYWGAVLTQHGTIVGVPRGANNVLFLDCGVGVPEDWALSPVFNHF